ncbi:MarR family transcriptional regulator [Aquibium sp. A9E412]|uniref:MarR family winged helix-turn-helix transcriptional regulator n=1 Tax=Aquibium sp. A9E412 TaxID=2976767 RepID=UPI0025AF2A76|nr:MarR family transcriptional regulator [Aquibium sp. A9E412]MDN2565656.1 MarR family transcriptional regulator [Aquibium sp. A9E412]
MRHRVDPNAVGFLVTDLARLIRAEFDRRIGDAALGVTAGEARALSHAARAGTVRQAVLAERMGVEAMTLSGYLDRLEARGLVTRSADPADRRAKLVRLTDAADAVLADIERVAAGIRAQVAGSMTAGEWEAFIGALAAARDNLAAARCAPGREPADAGP